MAAATAATAVPYSGVGKLPSSSNTNSARATIANDACCEGALRAATLTYVGYPDQAGDFTCAMKPRTSAAGSE